MSAHKYEELRSDSDWNNMSDDLPLLVSTLRASQRRQRRLLIFQWVMLAVTLTLLGLFLAAGGLVHEFRCPETPETPSRECRVPGEIYSPAQDVVRYHNVTYTPSMAPDITKYQGPPSDENYAAWEELYDFGLSSIPMSSAAQLVDKTVPIPGSNGQYAIALDVFHQLHCLNMIRLKLWAGVDPVYFNASIPEDMFDIDHIDHCIDSVRQSVMCHADTAPITWAWMEEQHAVKGLLTNHHTCRDFEAIRQWAIEHHAKSFDMSVHVEDPLDSISL